jgi:hypothetical protein
MHLDMDFRRAVAERRASTTPELIISPLVLTLPLLPHHTAGTKVDHIAIPDFAAGKQTVAELKTGSTDWQSRRRAQ